MDRRYILYGVGELRVRKYNLRSRHTLDEYEPQDNEEDSEECFDGEADQDDEE